MSAIEKNISDFEKNEATNQQQTRKLLRQRIKLFEKMFNIQQTLFHNHVGGIQDPYYGLNEYEQIVLQSYIKSINLLYASHKLTLSGYYGGANLILRQIFEFLLFGKYVFLKKDNNLALKWLENNQFNIYEKTIKFLLKPDKKVFHDFWILLCNYAHATTISHQITLSIEHEKDQIVQTYHVLLMLLRCNYHLLNSCFINKRLTYRAEYYGGFRNINKVLRMEAKEVNKEVGEKFSNLGNLFIQNYTSKWTFKK